MGFEWEKVTDWYRTGVKLGYIGFRMVIGSVRFDGDTMVGCLAVARHFSVNLEASIDCLFFVGGSYRRRVHNPVGC